MTGDFPDAAIWKWPQKQGVSPALKTGWAVGASGVTETRDRQQGHSFHSPRCDPASSLSPSSAAFPCPLQAIAQDKKSRVAGVPSPGFKSYLRTRAGPDPLCNGTSAHSDANQGLKSFMEVAFIRWDEGFHTPATGRSCADCSLPECTQSTMSGAGVQPVLYCWTINLNARPGQSAGVRGSWFLVQKLTAFCLTVPSEYTPYFSS